MKDFENFRNDWLTDDKLSKMQSVAENQAEPYKDTDIKSFMATFSATYTLQILNEYHQWVNREKD